MTPEPSKWAHTIAADPDHPHRRIECFEIMEAAEHNLYSEVRTVDAMVSHRTRILDAGRGLGRYAGQSFERGHHVVGVDIDPILIAAAQENHPEPTLLVDDLAELDLPARGIEANFDIIPSAGNVTGFLAPSTRVETLCRLRDHLVPGGHVVTRSSAGRGYEFTDLLEDVQVAGPNPELTSST